MVDDSDNTPANALSQAPVHSICEKPVTGRESAPMAKEEKGGDRLDRVLSAHGLNRNKLAKRVGLATSTAQKWRDALQRGDISDESWRSCANALIRVGIDPGDVRPGVPVPTRTRAAELVGPILNIESREVLNLILAVLSLDLEDDRDTVRELVNNKLKKI